MRNKIREKIVASVMLSAFLVTNSMAASFAMEDYGSNVRPMIRSGQEASLDLRSDIKIPNGESVVNLSLRDADITQVLRMFADQAGMNIIFAPEVEGTVTMDLVDIPLSEALSLVVKTNKLFYDIQANTLVISTQESSLTLSDRGKQWTIIPVRYVNAAGLAHFMNKNIFHAKSETINPGIAKGGAVTSNPTTNELVVAGDENVVALVRKIVEQFDKKPVITTFKVNHTTPSEMATSICSSLFPTMAAAGADGGGGAGGDSGSSSGGAAGVPTGFASDEGGGDDSGDGGGGGSAGISVGGGKVACGLTIQNFEEESADGEETFSLSSLPFLGMSVSYFPTLGTIQLIGGSDTQIDMVREYIAANDKKTPQAYLEVQIISLSESGSKTFDNTWQYLSKNFSFNAGGGNGFSTPSNFPIFWTGHGYKDSELSPIEQGVYGSPTKWSHSPHLVYAVNYLVENKKGRVLANPRVLLTSGQASTIDLTSDYVSKVTTQYLDNGSSTGTAQVQRDYEVKDDNGIKVSITPFISPDGYVTLDIKPEYKTIASQLYTKGEAGEEELAVTLLQRRDLDLKGVRIKDGETLVIGGMIQETETKTVKKIPFLGELPVVGMFFRSTNTSKAKEEMVIMLTPQIAIDTEDAVAEDNLL